MVQKTKCTVGLGERAYDIFIGPNLIEQAGTILCEIVSERHVVIVSDKTVATLHLKKLKTGLEKYVQKIHCFEVPSGESSKSMGMLSQLVDDILATGIDRSTLIIAFGGGVVGDLVGFASACLLRGVDFIQIPTSLLAQVDSAVGGKTGINTKIGKNLIGAFHQPIAVISDINLLSTLPRRELLSGYAEVVKYGLIGNKKFFAWLEDNAKGILELNDDLLIHAIRSSCEAKASIVEADEHETGSRALLNLGHTFGHAFEAAMDYDGRLLHGEAVAAGMALAFELSFELNFCEIEDVERCKRHLRKVGLPTGTSDFQTQKISAKKLISHMKYDKKIRNNKVNFILVRSIGNAFISDEVSLEFVEKFLKRGSNVC